jgi:alpha-D-ribose 1-methylphosphonate 5-phosphate C-P lyase
MKTGYSWGFLDEGAKREIRRAIVKAICMPGHQIPFASREMPIARGWGTGGLQITLSIMGRGDTVKVIDQGCDGSVNAVNLRSLISMTTDTATTTDTREATIIQTRHRIPEAPLGDNQVMVYQVPLPEPLRMIEPSEKVTRQMHGDRDYSRLWVNLYEDIVRNGAVTIGAGYPVRVAGKYVMSPSPIPRWDIARLDRSPALHLFGAGREKRIYAVPPYTEVEPLHFDDRPFSVESMAGKTCRRCGSTDSFMDELIEDGTTAYVCSDTDYCDRRVKGGNDAH